MKIIVYGMGYVGLANAILLSQKNEVCGIELLDEKLEKLNNRISPIQDNEIAEYLKKDDLNLSFTNNGDDFLKKADFAIIATQTNYDDETKSFDTSSVESIIEKISLINPDVTVIIKSTIPIGFVDLMSKKYINMQILFSPEFLREGKALYDNLYPSRIIVSFHDEKTNQKAQQFAKLLLDGSIEKNSKIILMGNLEAESVKLFSNAYLAMRVAYFNELDNFAICKNINSKQIIEGMCADPRIGNIYNNPSFGYGGYCFPKDTKQLYSNYLVENIPNELIYAIINSNSIRKSFLVKTIVNQTKDDDVIGIYRLVMKSGSDNCRSSAIFDIIQQLSKIRKIIIYEPNKNGLSINNCIFENDLETFKKTSNLIIANRIDSNIESERDKIFTRDIFGKD